MILSAASSSTQSSFGFEKLSRFIASSSRSPDTEGNAVRSASAAAANELSPEQQSRVAQLKQIDREVRAHEQAHLAVGADLVRGGASFSYETGPDKQRYAVAGEVSIDTSPGKTPAETIPKAQHIRATALAPADPSPQDHSVAAQASRMEREARGDLSAQQRSERAASGQDGAGFYRGVAQTADSLTVGGRLDFFA